MSEEDVRRLVASALRSPEIAIGQGGPWRCKVEVAFEGALVGARGVVRAAVAVRLWRPDSADEPAIEAAGVLEKNVDAGAGADRRALARALLERGLPDVVRPMRTEARLRAGPRDGIEKALADADPAVRKIAVRAAALRREAAIVPALVAHLRDEDATVADAAIGALATIGDVRAVRPLCDLVPMRDIAGMAKVLDAIAQIGGGEAVAYLDFVATGHEDAGVRAMAKQALDRMARRAR